MPVAEAKARRMMRSEPFDRVQRLAALALIG